MESLRVGHCSSCSNDCLIVIVADIPDYVLNAITSHRK